MEGPRISSSSSGPGTARLDALVASATAPLLREAGFRRTGRTFALHDGDGNWGLVNVQSSSSSSRSRASITANLGVSLGMLRRWEEPEAAEAAEAAPHYSNAHWLRRIGELMADGTDRWWTLHAERPATDAEEFVKPHSGAGPGEPTGVNLKNLTRRRR